MPTQLVTDTWITATWDDYLKLVEAPALEKAKCYYHNGKMRLEMVPVGNDHASDRTIMLVAVGLFSAVKDIPLNGKDNCTYRKTGFSEAQPDISYYIGDNANAIPYGTSIISLDHYPPPTLVVEIANTSLADDQGEKRLLYEDLGIQEYWIVNVKTAQVMAFAVANQGSQRIAESQQVLPGLTMATLNEALRRTREATQSQVTTWMLSQFQKNEQRG